MRAATPRSGAGARRSPRPALLLAGSGASIVIAVAACATPGATALEPGPVADAFAIPAPELLAAEAADLPVEPLEQEGVRGGRIVLALPGTPQQVLDMLLDFAHADGHRAWAEHYEPIAREGDHVVARWQFHGRMGINPQVEIAFDVEAATAGGGEPGERDILVRYHLTKPAFGLAAFFGDYRVRALPSAGGAAAAARSVLAERVFIDSGVIFANASADDITKGLREDGKRMRAWMQERLERGPDAR